MQDETSERVVALCIQGGKVTEQILKHAVQAVLAEMKRQEQQRNAEIQRIKAERQQKKGRAAYHGKQSMKKLRLQGRDLSSLEITDRNIRSFEKYARKYCVDYCLKKDRSSSPTRCYVFFRAGDADAVTAAFKEYAGHQMGKEKRESVNEKLQLARERAGKHKERDRIKRKAQEQSL